MYKYYSHSKSIATLKSCSCSSLLRVLFFLFQVRDKDVVSLVLKYNKRQRIDGHAEKVGGETKEIEPPKTRPNDGLILSITYCKSITTPPPDL